jgi:peptidoglycan/xylan/chitin deacetylase (PgdA/CDA1 family)
MTKPVQVALTFDFDAYSTWIGSHNATSPSMLSRGEFGSVGVRRILPLLDKYGAKATFFVPGHTALAFPSAVQAIVAAGHEIGHHGWVHENPVLLSPEEERTVLLRGLDALDKVAGVRPTGYRSPAWDNSPSTVPLLLEHGFAYESSMMGHDYEPYWCRVGDRWSKSEAFEFGTPVDLVELPVSWHLDDFPHFEFMAGPGGYLQGGRPTSDVLETWCAELDYLCERVGEGVLVLTMHPQIIGRGSRMLMLEAFLDRVANKANAEFTRCDAYVARWKQGKLPTLPAR